MPFALEYTFTSPFWCSGKAREVLAELQSEVETKCHYGLDSLAYKESNKIVISSFEVVLTGDTRAMKAFVEHKLIYRLKTRKAI
jgi:hypothetical protein